jgi:hypothetical protein
LQLEPSSTEAQWRDFSNDLFVDQGTPEQRDHYFRINPSLGYDPPALDDVKKIPRLREYIVQYLQSIEGAAQVSHVTRKLIASSFYYCNLLKVTPSAAGVTYRRTCSG